MSYYIIRVWVLYCFIFLPLVTLFLFFFIIIKLVCTITQSPSNFFFTQTMFSIFTHNLFQRDPFNTTIPTVKQTLMKTVARHFSALTFLSRHFQYHQQSFHWNRLRQLFADILRATELSTSLHSSITVPIQFNMSFHFHFSLILFLSLFFFLSLFC